MQENTHMLYVRYLGQTSNTFYVPQSVGGAEATGLRDLPAIVASLVFTQVQSCVCLLAGPGT